MDKQSSDASTRPLPSSWPPFLTCPATIPPAVSPAVINIVVSTSNATGILPAVDTTSQTRCSQRVLLLRLPFWRHDQVSRASSSAGSCCSTSQSSPLGALRVTSLGLPLGLPPTVLSLSSSSSPLHPSIVPPISPLADASSSPKPKGSSRSTKKHSYSSIHIPSSAFSSFSSRLFHTRDTTPNVPCKMGISIAEQPSNFQRLLCVQSHFYCIISSLAPHYQSQISYGVTATSLRSVYINVNRFIHAHMLAL